MTSMDEVSESLDASQSRREALQKFGRYAAAAAPMTMVLLEPRESHAARRNGGRRGRKGGGWGRVKGGDTY